MKIQPLMIACATAVLALTCSAAVAQDRNDHDRGQDQKTYRKFDDRQREHANTYYNQHRNDEAFRRDNRWNNDYESRLRPGHVLDGDMRGMIRPAPYDMIRGFGPAPRGYRYVVIGGHVVLIDGGYRVHDAIHFEINVGH